MTMIDADKAIEILEKLRSEGGALDYSWGLTRALNEIKRLKEEAEADSNDSIRFN